MTPLDSDIHSKSKIDNIVGVHVNPKLKPALKSCSRKKVLQTPTYFSHRRLLPFLMSVVGDPLLFLLKRRTITIKWQVNGQQVALQPPFE
ncbi:hypothetical protein L1987_61191 [Smallanthus sonchifolius]|uniref:Uncharacterized protein n=1 Tax=Smallanthus sonchifolius TaxID=185202 RepID=A0ACB9DAG8_9ASTR|nr:hypothetical protein L1987_61191 [Smallanthus sonchifolius]